VKEHSSSGLLSYKDEALSDKLMVTFKLTQALTQQGIQKLQILSQRLKSFRH